jgi:glycyl-tRNA synthetase beta chain
MLGVISLIVMNGLRLSWARAFQVAAATTYFSTMRAVLTPVVGSAVAHALAQFEYPNRPDQDEYGITESSITAFREMGEAVQRGILEAPEELNTFVIDRLKVQQLVRLLARVKALQAFVETPEGADLLAGYKRAANILKKEGWSATGSDRHPGLDPGSTSPSAEGDKERWMPDQVRHDEQDKNKTLSYTPEREEDALIAALDSAEPKARAAVEAEDFEGAMAALASLRGPVDSFFDKVTVNDPDAAKREARLALLARMRDAVHRVADFSRIEG